MGIFDKIKEMKTEVELEQCLCGSNLIGECETCDHIPEDHEVLKKIREVGDKREINPPKAKKNNDPSGVCPICEKTFTHLSRHKCKTIIENRKEEKEKGYAYDLYINAEIVYNNNTDLKIIRLCNLIKPLIDAIAKENQIEYWSLLDYAKGDALLAMRLERLIEAGDFDYDAVILQSNTREGKACLDVLQRHAEFVVKGCF